MLGTCQVLVQGRVHLRREDEFRKHGTAPPWARLCARCPAAAPDPGEPAAGQGDGNLGIEGSEDWRLPAQRGCECAWGGIRTGFL